MAFGDAQNADLARATPRERLLREAEDWQRHAPYGIASINRLIPLAHDRKELAQVRDEVAAIETQLSIAVTASRSDRKTVITDAVVGFASLAVSVIGLKNPSVLTAAGGVGAFGAWVKAATDASRYGETREKEGPLREQLAKPQQRQLELEQSVESKTKQLDTFELAALEHVEDLLALKPEIGNNITHEYADAVRSNIRELADIDGFDLVNEILRRFPRLQDQRIIDGLNADAEDFRKVKFWAYEAILADEVGKQRAKLLDMPWPPPRNPIKVDAVTPETWLKNLADFKESRQQLIAVTAEAILSQPAPVRSAEEVLSDLFDSKPSPTTIHMVDDPRLASLIASRARLGSSESRAQVKESWVLDGPSLVRMFDAASPPDAGVFSTLS